MKRGIMIFISVIFLLGIFLSPITIASEEFKSCSQDSDCKVDSCNENSCMNQSYQISECVKANLQAKECSCVENICDVLIGSVATPAITTPTQPTGSVATPAITTPTQPTIQPIQICTDSDNGNFYEKGTMKGAADDAGHTDLCGDYNTLTEYYCENNEAKKTAFKCPNGCKDGACLKGEPISEQITCIFKNSDSEQKCYLSEYNDKFFCLGKDNCVMTVQGYKDKKMIWKSSCGSYISTIIDGQNENAEFECKIGETTTIQIKNKGFRNAYFQCYGGEESKSTEREACKTTDFWKKFAENFCQSHCKGEKCGVNSFSVTDECYVEETTTPAVSTNPNQIPKITTQGMLYYFKADDCLVCQEMKKEFEILKQKGFFNNFGIMVYDTNDKNIPEKFEIKTLPTIILYKDKCLFKKQGFMKSEEIENWAYESKCGEEIKEENESIAESVLVCKDSCALEGKCYPFGYRKGGKFCSDNGGFTEQLKGESTCDNNFECSSNLCIDSQCVSQGLFQKIMDLFGKLFGGK